MSEAVAAVYLEQLVPYSELQLAEAIDDVIRNWTEPSKLPPVAVILDAVQARMIEAQLERQKIQLESKPPDWVVFDSKYPLAEEARLIQREYVRRGATAKNAGDYDAQIRQIRHDLGYADYKP